MEIGAVILAAVILYLLFRLLKEIVKLAINSVAGIIILFLLNLLFGLSIPINIFTILIVALSGIGGVFLILILHFLGLGF